jgi:predicted transcriptional regulator
MSTITTARQSLPEWARQAFDLCEQLGFKPKFDHDYPTPDYNKRVQVRAEKHVAPAAEVAKYAAAMLRNEKFPPIVVTRDGYLDDGATRAAAAKKNKFPTIPGLILDESFEGASQQVRERLFALGAAFNARNGKGIDRGEIRNVVEQLARNPLYDATRIAALLGVTEGMVRGFITERKGRDRAVQLGIEVGKLTAGQLKTIGRAEKTILDGPLTRLFELIIDAGLAGKDITALLRAMKECRSEAAAIKLLDDEREARREQIAMRRATGGRPIIAVAAQLRQHLGFVLKYCNGQAAEAVERNPAFQPEHLRKLEDSILALTQIAQHQRDLNPSEFGDVPDSDS